MKKLACFLFIAMHSMVIIAQDENTVLVDLTESMQFQKKPDFSSIRVIDARYDTTKIGFSDPGSDMFALGISRESKWVMLSISLETYLQEQLNFHCTKSPAANSFVLLINEFRFRSFKIQGKYYFSLKIDLLGLSGNDSAYKSVKRVDTIISGSSSLFSSKRKTIGNLVVEVMADLVVQITNRQPKPDSKTYSLEELEASVTRRFEKAILNTYDLRSGLYLSFEEFLNNAPSRRYDGSKKVPFSYYNGETDRRVWGYCDGSNYYINLNGFFETLIQHGNGYCIKVMVNEERLPVDEMKTKELHKWDYMDKTKRVPVFNLLWFDIDMKTGRYIDEGMPLVSR